MAYWLALLIDQIGKHSCMWQKKDTWNHLPSTSRLFFLLNWRFHAALHHHILNPSFPMKCDTLLSPSFVRLAVNTSRLSARFLRSPNETGPLPAIVAFQLLSTVRLLSDCFHFMGLNREAPFQKQEFKASFPNCFHQFTKSSLISGFKLVSY